MKDAKDAMTRVIAERQMVNVTKGDCAAFVWRAMTAALRKELGKR